MINRLKKYSEVYFNFFKTKFTAENRKEALWYFGGQFSVFFLGIVVIKILSQLGTDEYGKYALILSVSGLLGMTIYGPVTQSINRFYYSYSAKEEFEYFTRLIWRFIVSVSFILTILLAFIVGINYSLNIIVIENEFLLAAGLFIIGNELNRFSISLLNVQRKRKNNSILQIIEKTLIVFLLGYLLIDNELELFNALVIMFGLMIILGLIKIILAFKECKRSIIKNTIDNPPSPKSIRKTLLTYAFPFLLWGSAGWVQVNGEKWIVNEFLTLADVGIYAVMISIINAMIMIPSTFIVEFLSPIVYKQFADENNEEMIQQGIRYISIQTFLIFSISLCYFIFTYFFSKELITLVSNNNYTSYHELLPLFCVGIGLFYVGQALTSVGFGFNKPKIYLLPKIGTGIFSLISNIYLISICGLLGLAISTLLIGSVYIFLVYTANRNLLRVKIK